MLDHKLKAWNVSMKLRFSFCIGIKICLLLTSVFAHYL